MQSVSPPITETAMMALAQLPRMLMDMVVENDTSRKLATVAQTQNSTLNLADQNTTQRLYFSWLNQCTYWFKHVRFCLVLSLLDVILCVYIFCNVEPKSDVDNNALN